MILVFLSVNFFLKKTRTIILKLVKGEIYKVVFIYFLILVHYYFIKFNKNRKKNVKSKYFHFLVVENKENTQIV